MFSGCDPTNKVGKNKYSFGLLKKYESSVDDLQLLQDNSLTTEQLGKLWVLYLQIIKTKGNSCDESR